MDNRFNKKKALCKHDGDADQLYVYCNSVKIILTFSWLQLLFTALHMCINYDSSSQANGIVINCSLIRIYPNVFWYIFYLTERPNDAILQHGSWSALIRVIACWLKITCRYLIQFLLIINHQEHKSGHSQSSAFPTDYSSVLEKYNFTMTFDFNFFLVGQCAKTISYIRFFTVYRGGGLFLNISWLW